MRLLIDTNILLDYFCKREPFYTNARGVLDYCAYRGVQTCVAAHSITNTFFILRKDYSVMERRRMLLKLIQTIDIIAIDEENILAALKNQSFSDFEDCLQMECAKRFFADYIITRNVSDFQRSEIPAVTPEKFLAIVKEQ